MNGLSWREPELPVVQNVDAEVHDGLQSIRDALVRQLYLPVQWTGVVQALASTGIMRLGECGPGKVLTGLARRIDKSLDARALGTPGDVDAALAEWKRIFAADEADATHKRGSCVFYRCCPIRVYPCYPWPKKIFGREWW